MARSTFGKCIRNYAILCCLLRLSPPYRFVPLTTWLWVSVFSTLSTWNSLGFSNDAFFVFGFRLKHRRTFRFLWELDGPQRARKIRLRRADHQLQFTGQWTLYLQHNQTSLLWISSDPWLQHKWILHVEMFEKSGSLSPESFSKICYILPIFFSKVVWLFRSSRHMSDL